MICPHCKTEAMKILEDHYCQKCNKRVSEMEESKVLKGKSNQVKSPNTVKALLFGFIGTVLSVLILFFLLALLLGEISDTPRLIFLISTGLLSAFFGGFISAYFDPENFSRNALILAGIFVLLNTLFNFLSDINFLRTILGIFVTALFYPLPFLAGASFYKNWKP